MKFTNIHINKSNQRLSMCDFHFADILVPSVQKGKTAQNHYYFPSSNQQSVSLQVDLKEAERSCKSDIQEAKDGLSIDHDAFPYALSESQWWEYCLAPHSYLSLGEGKFQVGLNLFNRFLHLDLNGQFAQLVDPEVGNELLSTTNWLDTERQELWFASWPVEATVRRMLNPRDNVHVTVWKLSMRNKSAEQVWQGYFGDSLHQLDLSPDRRFLILTELGLRLWEGAIVPSKVLILDLKTGEEWHLPMPTAGHVEFDPEDPRVCYLSGHNIGLVGNSMGIFGSGTIRKYRLMESGPELLGEFTHPCFHRITTHIVFRNHGKILLGVSGYPGTVFLINALTMELHKTIEMDSREVVEAASFPHICRQDSYGIAALGDGRSLLVAGTGFIRVADIDDGRFSFTGRIEGYGAGSCFTGHVGSIHSPEKS